MWEFHIVISFAKNVQKLRNKDFDQVCCKFLTKMDRKLLEG